MTKLSHRKKLSSAERRDLIVRAAIELFARQGFRATRVLDIANKVGTSDALVFQHFPTKRELYGAILEQLCARKHFTEIEQVLYYAAEYDVEDVLTRLSAWVLEQTDREPEWLQLILYATLERDEAAPELLHEHFQRIIDYVAYEIAEGQKDGRYRAGDANGLARDFFAGLLGLGIMRTIAQHDGYRAETVQALAARHVATFLRGIEQARSTHS